MMIVKLYGGLGNQLFQWAFGIALSNDRNAKIKFDASSYSKDKLRKLEISFLVKELSLASDEEILRIRKEHNLLVLVGRKIKSKTTPYYKRNIICEKTYLYDSKLASKSSASSYYDGYWQNSKYFNHHRNFILNTIQFPLSTNEKFQALKKRINTVNSTSIHVRRGDFLQDPENLKRHGLCSIDYYKKAIQTIIEKYPDTDFFVFSDDIAWCKSNLSDFQKLYFVNETNTAFEDLELLTLCKNNITANSSFSWWGAWLNKNETKTVISPIKWFNQTDIDYSEIVPKNWIRL